MMIGRLQLWRQIATIGWGTWPKGWSKPFFRYLDLGPLGIRWWGKEPYER